jgi:prepilin-type N-terminal cleavage/methylation domain-containing protein
MTLRANTQTLRYGAAPGVCRRSLPRPAFTLVELLVSLAVLSIALAIVGTVFSIAVKTTRQAAAYSEANNWLRQYMEQLEDDLKYCEPSQSVLVLVGRTQAGALTPDGVKAGKFYRVLTGDKVQAAGYDPVYAPVLNPNYSNPRADILMFFTNRPTASQAPPPDADAARDPFGYACLNGARSSPIEVVYGHAALDEATWNASTRKYQYAGRLQHIEDIVGGGTSPLMISAIPLTRWHLARRATILENWPNTGLISPIRVQFDPTACDNIVRCQPYTDPLGQHMPGDGAFFDLPLFLQSLGPDYFTANNAPSESPYTLLGSGPWGGQWQLDNVNSIYSLLYSTHIDQTAPKHHVATVVENPPADLQGNLGVHMLPACAWFQVEFLMPEDPRNSLEYTPNLNWLPPGNYTQRQDMPRWTEVNADPTVGPTTYVFVPDTQANRAEVSRWIVNGHPLPASRLASFAQIVPPLAGGADSVLNRRVRMWPYALRITVRVFDPQGRLEQPIVRSLVHRFD